MPALFEIVLLQLFQILIKKIKILAYSWLVRVVDQYQGSSYWNVDVYD